MSALTPIFERIPQVWFLLGLLFIAAGLYLGFEFSLSFGYMAVGWFCCAYGAAVFVLRGRERPRAETLGPSREPIEFASAEPALDAPAPADPVAADPAPAVPVAAAPAPADPAPAVPVAAAPAPAEPVLAEPVLAEPAPADPAPAELAIAEPGHAISNNGDVPVKKQTGSE